jgi:alanine-alpha-ketoisovalerate/valine-pyruvate aminotransferase
MRETYDCRCPKCDKIIPECKCNLPIHEKFLQNMVKQLKAQNTELLDCLIDVVRDEYGNRTEHDKKVLMNCSQSICKRVKLIEKYTGKPIEEVLND